VGDAGYVRDPLTAHGITDALRDAELLARALARGTEPALEEYQETRDGLAMRFFEVTDQIASFEWDLESVKAMHLAMSEEMNKEVAAILELGELEREPNRRTA
jgi:2-polyprenyl-6-methoxyphenol hydroxylase-like FAD-dependent oxidoreductase